MFKIKREYFTSIFEGNKKIKREMRKVGRKATGLRVRRDGV